MPSPGQIMELPLMIFNVFSWNKKKKLQIIMQNNSNYIQELWTPIFGVTYFQSVLLMDIIYASS